MGRRLIQIASVLVPRRSREDWVQEWEAELSHRSAQLDAWGATSGKARRRLTLHAFGAFLDAGWMRIRGLHEGILLDLRHSLRGFRREPGFVGFTLLLIALGIGVNAALFAVVDAVLLQPLPYSEPERLVRVWDKRSTDPTVRESPSPGNFQYWRQHGSAFESLASWYRSSVVLRSGGDAQTYTSAQVSNDFFRVFGVAPLLGRTFTDEEVDRAIYDTTNTHRGEGPVVVLSHHLWQQRFGGDASIVGRDIELGAKAWQVIGVMPDGFAMPDAGTDLWVAWSFARERPKDQHYSQVAGRIADGMSADEASARMHALAAEMATSFPETNEGWDVELVPLIDHEVGAVRSTLWTLLAAVACLLGIACLNIAGLQVVRATARQREVAVRMALGASRTRLIRQFMIEGLMLATAGGALGILIAQTLVQLLRSMELAALPRLDAIALDARVIAFAFALTALTGVAFSLVPAILGSRKDPMPALKNEAVSTTASRSRRSLRNALVVAEVALAVTLLIGAGLLFRSFRQLSGVDHGFQVDNVLVLPVFLDGVTYGRGGTGSSRQYYIDLMERLESLPGVESAGGATALPLSPMGPDFFRPVWREGRQLGTGEEAQADIRMATPGYFDTLGIRLVDGRLFDAGDNMDSGPTIIVNASLARRHFPTEPAVGQELVIDYASIGTYPYRIVGVVGDLHFYGPRQAPRDEVYIPHAQRPYLIMNVAVRTSAPAEAMVETVRRAVLEIDPAQPVHSIVPLERLMGNVVQRDRLSALLLIAFAVVALLLSGAGLYGVLSYQVRQRSQEIGIRMALGARAAEIQRWVLGDGMKLVGVGLVIGLGAALFLSRWIAAQLFGIRPADPATLATVCLVLGLVAMLACWLPARRAARSDPLRSLRHE